MHIDPETGNQFTVRDVNYKAKTSQVTVDPETGNQVLVKDT